MENAKGKKRFVRRITVGPGGKTRIEDQSSNVSIPYFPMKYQSAVSLSRPFKPLGSVIVSARRDFSKDVLEADLTVEPVEYASVAVFAGVFYFVFLFIAFFLTSMNPELEMLFPYSSDTLKTSLMLAPVVISFVMMNQVMNYPGMLARKKAHEVDKNLLYALRHMTVQVRSGATLFEAMKSIAFSDYGRISDDMDETVKQVASGFPIANAIDQLALRNKSKNYRKIMWQLENALRTGSDVGAVLMAMSENYFQEQKIAIERFGRELNTLTMVFLITTVIFPVMAVIVIVMTSLIPVQSIPSSMLYLLLGTVTVVQIMIIGYIKERRPPVHF
jgi:flagellar protein FlaJ